MAQARQIFCFGPFEGPNIDDYLIKEVQAVLSTVLETYCGVISRLVLRSLRKQQGPRNGENDTDPHKVENSSSGAAISDILQILGILSHLESLGLIVFLDERIWRAILFACQNIGGHLMYRICIVLYNCAARFSSHFWQGSRPFDIRALRVHRKQR